MDTFPLTTEQAALCSDIHVCGECGEENQNKIIVDEEGEAICIKCLLALLHEITSLYKMKLERIG